MLCGAAAAEWRRFFPFQVGVEFSTTRRLGTCTTHHMRHATPVYTPGYTREQWSGMASPFAAMVCDRASRPGARYSALGCVECLGHHLGTTRMTVIAFSLRRKVWSMLPRTWVLQCWTLLCSVFRITMLLPMTMTRPAHLDTADEDTKLVSLCISFDGAR